MAGKCADCAHANMATAPDKAMVLNCHRYPPAVAQIVLPQGLATVCSFPRVEREWHCAEYKTKASVIAS